MHDLDAFLRECCQTLDSLGIPYAKEHKIIIDPRLKRCWGSCRKRADGSYVIKISSVLLDDAVRADSLKDTLYHELLHTAPDAMSHGEAWRNLAQQVSRATGLTIKRSTPASEKGIVPDYAKDPSVKFLCVCEGCGAQIVRYRDCSFVRRHSRYRCGTCGGKFKVLLGRF